MKFLNGFCIDFDSLKIFNWTKLRIDLFWSIYFSRTDNFLILWSSPLSRTFLSSVVSRHPSTNYLPRERYSALLRKRKGNEERFRRWCLAVKSPMETGNRTALWGAWTMSSRGRRSELPWESKPHQRARKKKTLKRSQRFGALRCVRERNVLRRIEIMSRYSKLVRHWTRALWTDE